MPHSSNPDSGAHDDEQRGRSSEETLPRVLYWWHVPETPATGRDILIFIGVWFATLVALAVIISVIATATG